MTNIALVDNISLSNQVLFLLIICHFRHHFNNRKIKDKTTNGDFLIKIETKVDIQIASKNKLYDKNNINYFHFDIISNKFFNYLNY